MGPAGSGSIDQKTIGAYGNHLDKFEQYYSIRCDVKYFDRCARMGALYNRETSGDHGGTFRFRLWADHIFADT